MRTREEIREALTGPVGSIRTPFKRNGDIDVRGVQTLIDRHIAAGNKAILLTAGDSLYFLLFPEEIAEVTRIAVKHAAGRAMVVAADNGYPTSKAVEFARFARETGADLYMVRPPEWTACNTAETLVEHFSAVARHIPVMLVTNTFSSRGHAFGLKTLEMVRDNAPGVVAVKDDLCGEFGRKMALLVHERWAVYSGGLKQNHLDIHPYGCDGYLSTFISFKPEIAQRYWLAITANDMTEAVRIIRAYEIPFFNYIMALPGGFDAGMHGMLEVCGIAKRWRRPPFYSLSDGEMERLRDFVTRLFSSF